MVDPASCQGCLGRPRSPARHTRAEGWQGAYKPETQGPSAVPIHTCSWIPAPSPERRARNFLGVLFPDIPLFLATDAVHTLIHPTGIH